MHGLVLAAALAIGAARMDTTLAVSHGARLELENYAGDIVVQTWDRNSVRIEAEHGRRTSVDIDSDDNAISVSVSDERGAPASVDFQLTVPTWMSLKLSGVYCDIQSTGLKGSLEAETVQGDVEVKGGSGRVQAQSVQGSVSIEDASGEIEASSVNEYVSARSVRGRLTAESVNGAVVVRQSELESLEASTVNGTVVYDGTFIKNGHYELSTHSGSVYVAIPQNADLDVQVSTYSGSFDSTFPVKRSGEDRHGHRFEFSLGNGGAELDLESFQGDIQLHRPGEHVEGLDEAIELKSSNEDKAERAREKAIEKAREVRQETLEKSREKRQEQLEKAREKQREAVEKAREKRREELEKAREKRQEEKSNDQGDGGDD